MKRILLVVLCCTWISLTAADFEYYPGAVYDASVPTLESVAGHGWGEDVSSHAQIDRYVHALAEASPKVRLQTYARSWEGRPLSYLIVSSEENLARLEEIQAGGRQIAYPDSGEGTTNLERQPVIVWLLYGVHGNEISSPNAAMLAAYHLAAAQGDALVDSILENCVVLIDPSENPDGRDRFVNYFRQTRGRWPDADPNAAEHNESWPMGRSNHYFFDLNRDWFARTQPETRGRIDVFLQWFPQVVVDLHEMGGESTYYFAPPADPLNPVFTSEQVEWLRRFGQNNAAWFDRNQIDYYTREVFDSFYPGYGEGWPMFNGSIGMTYEQASVRGLILDRRDGTTLDFRESVRNHFLASLATLETAAQNRAEMLSYFEDFRRSVADWAAEGPIREYLLPPGPDPLRTTELAGNLVAQGIEVRRAREAFRMEGLTDSVGRDVEAVEFPEGTYLVPLAQPSGRLAATLLARHVPMDDEFLSRQKERRSKGLRDEIYDVTAWSLPLLYDVECYGSPTPADVASDSVDRDPEPAGEVRGGTASLAYLVPWGPLSSAKLLAELQRREIRVHASDEPFSIHGVDFGAGSLIIKVRDNPDDLYRQLNEVARSTGAIVYPTNTAWVSSGVNFGSDNVRYLEKPRIAMAYGPPTDVNSVGAIRYVMDQVYGYPVTVIHTSNFPRVDLSKYNVLILPDSSRWQGGYEAVLGERGGTAIRDWVRGGGTLIAIGGATAWLTGEKVGLLKSSLEKKEKPEESESAEEEAEAEQADVPPALAELIEPEEASPDVITGAMVRVRLDPTHWLAFGYDEDTTALVASNRVFTPVKLDQGYNVGVYFPSDQLLVSGFAWEDAVQQLGNKAFLMYSGEGRGRVVAFAEDPLFRAYTHGLELLFLNGVLLGPGR